MIRRIRIIVFTAFLALALTVLPAMGKQSVNIGINYPLTGPYSVEGLDQIRAARMAVDEINHTGGILGHRVHLLTRNSASNVLQTQINVNELINSNCTMIFGGSSSAVAIASAEICQKRNVIFFGTLTYSTATTLEGAQKTSFRECNNSWMSAQVMADWLNTHYAGKRYHYITADYTWGWTTEDSIRQVTDTMNQVDHQGALTPLGAVDFSVPLQQAKKNTPDVLVLSLFGKDLAYALQQAAAMDFKDTLIVAPNLTLGMAERSGAAAMENVVGTVPWTWNIPYLYDYARGKEFVEEFVKRFHRHPSSSGASAYTIVYEYKNAVERAGSFETAKVVQALEGHEYTLLKDAQWWRPMDHQSVQTVYMVRGKDLELLHIGTQRMDLFTILSSKPGELTVRPPEEWKRLRRAAGLPETLPAPPQWKGKATP